LQLINFWQDLSVDLKKGRCYIPTEILNGNKKDNLIDFFSNIDEKKLNSILDQCYDITRHYLTEGEKLLSLIKNLRLKLELRFILFTAKIVFNKTIKLKEKVIYERPKLNFW
jgi:phytoene/squalene synthetase